MAKTDWSRQFEDLITLPDGRELLTLKEAADYIIKLPNAEQKHEKWQVAVSCLLQAAEGRGPVMFGRIGFMQALFKDVERVFNRDRVTGETGSWRAIGDCPAAPILIECSRTFAIRRSNF